MCGKNVVRMQDDMTLTASSAAMAKRPGRYGDGRGLYLMVQPSGSKSWILRMQQALFRTDRGLGSYPTVSLAEARTLAEALRVQVRQANGHAPRKDRQPSDEAPRGASSWSKSPTFEQVARRFHETNVGAGGWTNDKNISAWMGRAEKHLFPIIGRLPIDQVTVNQIRDGILIPTALSKPETAKRLRIIIRQTFEYAMESGFANANPIDRIPSKRLPKPKPKFTPRTAWTFSVSEELIGERTIAGSYEGHVPPRPDDRPRSPAAPGVSVQSCAQADSGRRGRGRGLSGSRTLDLNTSVVDDMAMNGIEFRCRQRRT